MSNNYKKTKHDESRDDIVDINFVPYIDVMLVLLIIFMVSAPLFYQEINIQLPETKQAEKSEAPNNFLIIDIYKDDIFSVNYSGKIDDELKEIPFETIISHYKQEELKQVFLRSDKNVVYGKVVFIMDKLRESNIKNIGLITSDANTNQ